MSNSYFNNQSNTNIELNNISQQNTTTGFKPYNSNSSNNYSQSALLNNKISTTAANNSNSSSNNNSNNNSNTNIINKHLSAANLNKTQFNQNIKKTDQAHSDSSNSFIRQVKIKFTRNFFLIFF